MQAFLRVVLVTLVFLAGCGRKDSGAAAKPTNTPAGSNPLTAPGDYVGAIDQARKSALKTVDLASVSKAVQMFSVEEGRYPKDLNELVTLKYLPALPALPAGVRYDYDPKTGQVRTVRQQGTPVP